ncbi:lipase family protein [Phytopseudomonas dryadis]|uniref:Lipase n=1 Tax=Phytopseudomonas dryadis TaxID=2487520 RepID=A0ABY1Z0P6_9GAMM|nr:MULTISPECIES: lipase family protein [Pseudomonas]TBV01089.1 lipase [Pseudomonas dryadis]TBV13799.1 lipase [Pseudomonas sp. FRB 230]
MNLLTPRQASLVADNVYNTLTLNLDMAEMAKRAAASMSDVAQLFDFSSAEGYQGNSGVAIRSQSGFAYAADGIGGRQGEMLIAFRGTQTVADAVTDAHCDLQRGPSTWPVHAGFNNTFMSMRDEVMQFLRGKNPSAIHLVGHSLGSAIATLMADHLSELGAGSVKLYTFGCPRVGTAGFARNLTGKLGTGNINRVFHDSDVVPMVPLFPFLHLPVEGDTCKLPWGGLVSGDAHRMPNYMNSVKDASWTGLRRLERSQFEQDIEAWLDSARNGGVLQLSSATFWMLSSAIGWVLKQILSVAGGAFGMFLGASLTVIDQIAAILIQGVRIGQELGEQVRNLVVRIFQFLGRPLPTASDVTSAFLRWMLNLLFTTIGNLARKALNSIGQLR